jgi:uncharacterized damage-inducible protein DinB
MSSSLAVIISLFRHMAWADARVIDALRASPGLDEHALEQFAHVVGAESVWLTRILGEPDRVAVWPALSVDECATLAAENQRGYASVVGGGEAGLERQITYTNSAGKTYTNRVIDILVHVAMHGSYHRGMISILTRRSGGVAAPTDFIAFVRGEPAATRSDAPAQPNARSRT